MKTDVIKSVLNMESRLIRDLTLLTYNFFRNGSLYKY